MYATHPMQREYLALLDSLRIANSRLRKTRKAVAACQRDIEEIYRQLRAAYTAGGRDVGEATYYRVRNRFHGEHGLLSRLASAVEAHRPNLDAVRELHLKAHDMRRALRVANLDTRYRPRR